MKIMATKFSEGFSNRRILVNALVLFFGLGAWLGVEAIYVQLPLLIQNAPEGARLPAFVTMVGQFANVGPILYSLYAKYTSQKRDHLLIYGLFCGGIAALFCLVFLHEETSYIFGTERSTAILASIFVVSLLGCTSSLLFIPYMRNYREVYLVTFFVGEGLGGCLPSILALIQGVDDTKECVNATDTNSETSTTTSSSGTRFSTPIFFALNGGVLLLSFIAFIALSNLSIHSTERNHVKLPSSTEHSKEKMESESKMSRRTYIYLMVMMGVICAIGYSSLSSIQPYACLPYGNVAYHLSVTLGVMVRPLATCIGFFVKNQRVDVLSYVTAGIICLAGFLYYLAAMSPAPPLENTRIGAIIVVVASVALNGMISFVRLGVTAIFQPDPGMGLFFTGVATQIGLFSGTVITFCLINYTGIFVEYSSCSDSL